LTLPESPAPNFLIDTHCHFDFEVFDGDRSELWAICQQKNICKLVIPGIYPSCLNKAKQYSEQYDGVYFSAGIHPWWLEKHLHEFVDIEAHFSHFKCVAVGECGLDKSLEVDFLKQRSLFEQQLSLAKTYDLPVIVHNRKSNNEILQSIDRCSPPGGVAHGFSGSYEFAMELVRRGFLIGVGGVVTYARAAKTRSAVARLPLSAIVLETDAPDMPLSGKQGKRNSPEYIPELASCVAELKQLPVEELVEQTTANARGLFGF